MFEWMNRDCKMKGWNEKVKRAETEERKRKKMKWKLWKESECQPWSHVEAEERRPKDFCCCLFSFSPERESRSKRVEKKSKRKSLNSLEVCTSFPSSDLSSSSLFFFPYPLSLSFFTSSLSFLSQYLCLNSHFVSLSLSLFSLTN